MFGMCQYPQKRMVFVKEYNCINVWIVAIISLWFPSERWWVVDGLSTTEADGQRNIACQAYERIFRWVLASIPAIRASRDLHPLDNAHDDQAKKRTPRISPWGSQSKKAATYSPALHCSTIGATGLNFSVRNGKRWDPGAITTWYVCGRCA